MTFSKANQKSKLKTDLVVVTNYDDLYLFQINLTVFLTDRFKYQMFGKYGHQFFFFLLYLSALRLTGSGYRKTISATESIKLNKVKFLG